MLTNPIQQFDKVNFTKSYNNIRSSKKLTPIEKFIIEDILSFQFNNQIYFKSIADMADDFGSSIKTIKRAITNLLKYDWFQNDKNSKMKKNGGFFNSSNRTIHIESFLKFLNEKHSNNSKKVVEDTPSTIENNKLPSIQIDNDLEEISTTLEEIKDLRKVTTNEDGSINITHEHTTSNKDEIDEFLRLNGEKEIKYITAHIDFLDGDVPMSDEVVRDKYGKYIHKFSIEKCTNELKKVEITSNDLSKEMLVKKPIPGHNLTDEEFDEIFQ